MPNPFSGIITSNFKNLHKNMIGALLENSALTVQCLLVYENTKSTECPNCRPDPFGGRGRIYKTGGPAPFAGGTCKYCDSKGLIFSSSTEDIWLMCIFDSKQWTMPYARNPDVVLQTMSKIDTLDNIKRCTYMKINDSNYSRYKATRFSLLEEPAPCGLNDNNFIIASWKLS